MLTKQILPGMWSKRIAQSLLVGIENGTAALEDGVVVFYETIYFIAIRSSNYVPWYLSKAV